jgi:hypothetical protein
MPYFYYLEEGESGQKQRESEGAELGKYKDLPLIKPVSHHASGECTEEDRQ